MTEPRRELRDILEKLHEYGRCYDSNDPLWEQMVDRDVEEAEVAIRAYFEGLLPKERKSVDGWSNNSIREYNAAIALMRERLRRSNGRED